MQKRGGTVMLNGGIEEQWDIPHRVLFPSGLLKASGPVCSLCLDSSVYFWQALTTSAFVQLANKQHRSSCTEIMYAVFFSMKVYAEAVDTQIA